MTTSHTPCAAEPAVDTRLDLRGGALSRRDAAALAAFRSLPLGASLDIVDDHDPQPLFQQFQREAPGNFSWLYREFGPEVWRVAVRKLSRAHGSGECCGACGGRDGRPVSSPSIDPKAIP
jgi:uncharacterized protein (DUF2249 family)